MTIIFHYIMFADSISTKILIIIFHKINIYVLRKIYFLIYFYTILKYQVIFIKNVFKNKLKK